MSDNARGARCETSQAVVKAGWRILPLLGFAYLIAFMDRFNIGFAATQMNVDLGFSATVYGLGAGMFFLAYSLFEIPSNLLLLQYGARRWIARIMISWGLLSAAMMFVSTPLEFYTLRFLIGTAEAGFFPGAVFYLSNWFPRAQRGRAISIFYLFGPLSSMVMGWVSGWLLGLDGIAGLRGWQWLFLVEGLPAVAIGFVVLFFLPDAPDRARWLSGAEREGLLRVLAAERQRGVTPPSHDVRKVLRNPAVVLLAVMGGLSASAGITFTLSAPLILVELTGRSVQQIGTLVSVGGLLGAAAMALTGWFTDRKGERFSALQAGLGLMASALLAIALAPSPGAIAAAYLFFAVGTWTMQAAKAALWCDVLRDRELAIGAAAINTVQQMGAFFLPFAFGTARDVTGSYTAGLFALPVLVILAMAVTTVLSQRVNAPALAKAL